LEGQAFVNQPLGRVMREYAAGAPAGQYEWRVADVLGDGLCVYVSQCRAARREPLTFRESRRGQGGDAILSGERAGHWRVDLVTGHRDDRAEADYRPIGIVVLNERAWPWFLRHLGGRVEHRP
jgi:hypothetical protein